LSNQETDSDIPEGTPFSLLRQMERLGRDHKAALPSREDPKDLWAGVGFRLGTQHFVSSMEEISELLKYPELSPIPLTRTWVKGLANVRGNLLPIMDLNGYLGRSGITLTRASRVLVIHADALVTGVLVDEVFGMRQFAKDDLESVSGDLDESLMPYVSEQFFSDDQRWLVFSMSALIANPQFMQVAG